jgi:hypothetical protein
MQRGSLVVASLFASGTFLPHAVTADIANTQI